MNSNSYNIDIKMKCIRKIKLKENNLLNNIDSKQSYFYWSDKIEIKKLISIKEELKYLPCYPYDDIDYNNLIDNDVFVFFKNPKILYCTFNVKSIIINENINMINNQNDKIIADKNIFTKLIKKYNLVEIPGLFFIEFNNLNVFEYEINIKMFNEYFKDKKKYLEFKYPPKVKDIHIIKNYCTNFLLNLSEYQDYQIKIKTENNESESDSESESQKFDKNKKKEYSIPILWNPCKKIKNELKNNDIKKKEIVEHITNCVICEKNNNNTSLLECKNKKIVIKYVDNKNNSQITENIIKYYQRAKKFNVTEGFDIDLETNKINIIISNDTNSIYKGCFFIIE